MMQPILIVIGTRPEGIKMIPIYWALKQQKIPVILCSTSQHRNLLQRVFNLFNVQPDIDFNIMKAQQNLAYLTETILQKMEELLPAVNPSALLVQGDTTTALAASLAGFYHKISIVHIEAGLRTKTIAHPFPEEMNRRLITQLANYHCAPTPVAVANLLHEHIDAQTIFCTGNTSIDALYWVQQQLAMQHLKISSTLDQIILSAKSKQQKIILLTIHRRESLETGIQAVFKTVEKLLTIYQDIIFIFPAHPNPVIQQALHKSNLATHERFHCLDALDYHELIYTMQESYLIMTDSGGMQEEAAALGKTTLVLRQETERTESVQLGLSFLVGTDEEIIACTFDQLITAPLHQVEKNNVYGDGHAAQHIAAIIAEKYYTDHLLHAENTINQPEYI